MGLRGRITIAKVDIVALVVLLAAVAVVVVATTALARGEAATMAATEEAGHASAEAVARLPVPPLEASSPVLAGVASNA